MNASNNPRNNSEQPRSQSAQEQLSSEASSDLRASFRYKVFITVTIVAIVVLVILLFLSTLSIIPLIFVAILIAVLLRSLANPVSRLLPISGRWTVILVALSLIVLLAVFFGIAGPSIIDQFDQLGQRIPRALGRIEESLHQYDWGVTLLDRLQQVPANMGNFDLFSRLTGFFSNALGILTNTLLVLVAGIYMAFEPDVYVKNFIRLFPIEHRDRAGEVMAEGYDHLRQWLLGRLLSMIVIGVLTFIGLTLIGMPLALTLAVIAGLLSAIPNLGPILAAVPAILVGLTESLLLGGLVALLYFIVQQIENYLITPGIQRKTVSLPPALVILSQIFLALLFGWLGLFIAAPVVTFTIVVVKLVYVEDFLGDKLATATTNYVE